MARMGDSVWRRKRGRRRRGVSVEDLDAGGLGQAVGAGGDDAVAFLDAVGLDFHEAVFLEARFYVLMDGLVALKQGDDGVAVFIGDDGFARDGERIFMFFGDDADADGKAGTEAGI